MKIHQINGFIQSMYLVQEGNALLLLDGGTRADVKIIIDYIENNLNMNLDNLKLVIITHAHPDHCGGATLYKKLGVKIAAPENINSWYLGFSGLCTYWVDILLTYLVAARKRGKTNIFHNLLFARTIKADFELKDNDPIPFFKEWSVIKTAGHTHCDLSIYHKVSSTVYVADNILTSKGRIFSPYPISFPVHYKESIQKYIDRDIQNYLMAHYGQMKIDKEKLLSLKLSTKDKRRSHRNSLYKIIVKLLKSIFKT